MVIVRMDISQSAAATQVGRDALRWTAVARVSLLILVLNGRHAGGLSLRVGVGLVRLKKRQASARLKKLH
jgi:hypothetical protein